MTQYPIIYVVGRRGMEGSAIVHRNGDCYLQAVKQYALLKANGFVVNVRVE